MRESLQQQIPLTPGPIAHPHAQELQDISTLLDSLPEAAEWVCNDVLKGKQKRVGRDGMSGEQVLRALIIKQMNDFSYDELAFHLMDSNCYRRFCRLGLATNTPSRSTLQRNIKRVEPETLEKINRLLMKHAAKKGIEKGRKIRTDCTVVDAWIHEPTDSSLLWDCARVLARNLQDGRELTSYVFSDHRRRAKRRAMEIFAAKRMAARVPLYKDLLMVTEWTIDYAVGAIAKLKAYRASDLKSGLRADSIAATLEHYIPLARRVVQQTRRRVVDGESVPSSEKLVSIFEEHTDIIVKGRRETLYGHKICLTAGVSGLVTDCTIEAGNPADAKLATKMIERHMTIFGCAPKQAAFDGGFASKSNLAAIKALGVKDVAFSKRCGLQITDMVKSSWVYHRLRNFRAGVESVISFLKRGFAMGRCTWRSLRSFKSYVWGSVLSANLLTVVRNTA